MGDYDDFGELYAGLENPEVGIVLPVEVEEGDEDELEEQGAGYENGAVESCSTTDSDDDLQIVLNEDDYSNRLPFQLTTASRVCEENDLVVTGVECYAKEIKMADLGHSVDGLLPVNRERGRSVKGAYRNPLISCAAGSAFPSKNSLSGRSHWEHLTAPCSFGNTSYNLGFSMAFPNGYDFYLPRNRSIFDIDVDSFECKPWRFNGVDVTDYFNFGLDEEGWRSYCKQLVLFQQIKLPVFQYSNLNKPTGTMDGEVAQDGHGVGFEIPNCSFNERKNIRMPKGRAIQVESGNGDRIPSIDVRRPRNYDSDVVIQITTGLSVDDALDPITDQITHSENSKNEFPKSSFSVLTGIHKCEGSTTSSEHPCPFMEKHSDEELDTMDFGMDSPLRESLTRPDAVVADCYCSGSNMSDHNSSFEASRNEVFVEKVPSPECIHFNSDSRFQESVLSDCYLSGETVIANCKIDCTACGGDSSESLLDLNTSQQETPHKIVKLNLSSDDGATSPLHGQKEDVEQQKESGTIIRKWDDETNERGRSSRGKISSRKNIKENKRKGLKAASFLTSLRGNYDDPSPVINREKRSIARQSKTRRNDFYANRRSQHKGKIQSDIVSRRYLQSNSQDMPLYDRRGCRLSGRVDERDMMMKTRCRTKEAKGSCRERSLNESRERSLDDYKERSLNECREISLDGYRERTSDEYFKMGIPYVYEEEEISRNKCDRLPCISGALKRFNGLHSHGENHLVDSGWSSTYADSQENSRLYEGGLHTRIYRDINVADGRDCHVNDFYGNQVPKLFKPDKRYMSYNGFSHSRETFSSMSNKHLIVPTTKCHKFSSRTGFNFGHDLSAERTVYSDNSAYNERKKNRLPFPEILPEEVSFRHHDINNLSSLKTYTLHGTVHHQNGQTDKKSFSGRKVSRYCLRNSSGNEFNVSGKNSDSSVRVGSLSDDFVKDRHELGIRCCREAVSKHLICWKVKNKGRCTSNGGRSQLDNELSAIKESRDSNNTEEHSNYKMKITQNHVYPEKEVEELEEGQLVEESDSYETADIQSISDGITTACTAKTDLTYAGPKNKLVGGYDRNHLLKTLAKMEKRRERFKDPIMPKKAPEICGDLQPDTCNRDEVKQRPSRKRRWCAS